MRCKTALLLMIVILTGAYAAQAQSRCPAIRVSVISPGPFLPPKFKADVSGVDPQAKLTFNWSVSTGAITSGQGSDLIEVDIARARGRFLTATVEVGGTPAGCPNEESESVLLFDGPVAIKKEEYGRISFRDERKILLSFAKRLRKNPGAAAHIEYYADTRARAGAARWRAKRARRYLIKAGIHPRRISVFDGGRSQDLTIQLFIVLRRPEVQ
jgi:hypothetical protein